MKLNKNFLLTARTYCQENNFKRLPYLCVCCTTEGNATVKNGKKKERKKDEENEETKKEESRIPIISGYNNQASRL